MHGDIQCTISKICIVVLIWLSVFSNPAVLGVHQRHAAAAVFLPYICRFLFFLPSPTQLHLLHILTESHTPSYPGTHYGAVHIVLSSRRRLIFPFTITTPPPCPRLLLSSLLLFHIYLSHSVGRAGITEALHVAVTLICHCVQNGQTELQERSLAAWSRPQPCVFTQILILSMSPFAFPLILSASAAASN